jgi:hypothetical protein
MGIAERVGGFGQIPDVLGRWEVLGVAAFLYAMEFVADKIPYVDSTWDVISTAIRPTVGAVSAYSSRVRRTRSTRPWPVSSAAAAPWPPTW